MKYYKIENGEKIYAGNKIEFGNSQIINPTSSILLKAGYIEEPDTLDSLEDVKSAKLEELAAYDNSDAVNSFTYNGVSSWFTADERKGYEQSILSCETLGITDISVPIGDNIVEMKVSDAKVMLAKIHLYADSCFLVTLSHRSAINKLETIEEVKAYNYKVGYPNKLSF